MAALAVAQAAAATPEQTLADRYSPVMMLRPQSAPCDTNGEAFVPIPVTAVLDNPDVALQRLPGGGESAAVTLATSPGAKGVANLGRSYQLNLPGDPLNAGCTYEKAANSLPGSPPPTTYAHIVAEPGASGLALQYWFYWYFNDWNNKHEGDWEMIQVSFPGGTVDEALRTGPDRVAYAQHAGGQRKSWDDPAVRKEGTHPVVYPGEGSHASYYDSALYLGTGQSGAGLGCDNTLDATRRVALTPVLVRSQAKPDDPDAWVTYLGHWGEDLGGFNGAPDGPNAKQQWLEPMRWMNDLATDAPALPGGQALGPTTTGFFCGAVAVGSQLVLKASDNPWVVLVPLAILMLVLWFLKNRTIWEPNEWRPVEERRRAGQVLSASRELWRRHLLRMAGLGIAFVILAVISGVITALVLSLPGMSAVVDAAQRPGLLQGLAALIGGALGMGIAFAITSAAVAAGIGDLAHDRPLRARTAYRQAFRRIGPVAWTAVLSTVIVVLLAVTVIGIPLAVKKGVDWIFSSQEAMLGGLSGRAALRRSTDLVRGRWWSTLAIVVTVVVIALVSGPLVGVILIYVFKLPPVALNLVSSLIFMVSVPYMVTATTLLWFDRRIAGPRVPGADAAPVAPASA